MNILLVGEFSGVHNNLKKGLNNLGHCAKIISGGDSWKQFQTDIDLYKYPRNGVLNYIKNAFYFGKITNSLKSYDVIQFINPMILPIYVIIYFYFFKKTHVVKYVYYACGTDPAFLESKNKFDYFPFDDESLDEKPTYHCVRIFFYNLFIRYIDDIVPAMYMYYLGYQKSDVLREPIPLPGSGNYSTKHINKPLKILFGISRKGFKGAKTITNAIATLESDKSLQIEFKIVEKLPYKEYEKLLKEHDVLIDQCKSYDYGMNAIIGLEKGLIVLSGNEDESSKYLKIQNNPIININNNTDSVVNALLNLEASDLEALNIKSKNSYEHAIAFHNPISIAKQFVEKVYHI